MIDTPCALLRVCGLEVAIPAAAIAAVGSGTPPGGLPAVRLESVLAGDQPIGDSSRFLHLAWSDGEALVLTFDGTLRFAGLAPAAVRPLGAFLAGLRELIGALGVAALSDSEVTFVLDPRALLSQARTAAQ